MKKVMVALMALLAITVITGCDSSKKVSEVQFKEVPLAQTDVEKTSIRVSYSATVVFADGTSKEYKLAYNEIYRTSDKDSDGTVVGTLIDQNGNGIKMKDGSIRVSTQPDTNSIIKKDDNYYLITHFEESPGALYMTELERKDGKFVAKDFIPVDFSKVDGTFINCAGAKTPWNTHLASEEDYYLDAVWFDPATKYYTSQHIEYCDRDSNGMLTGEYTAPAFDQKADYKWWCEIAKGISQDYMVNDAAFTPYNYGYNIEIDIVDGKPVIVKDSKTYVTGKHTPEMAIVMPDKKTVFTSDDGSYTGLYMNVLDEAKNFDAATLYMAKWEQVSAENGGKANLKWVKLGHATNDAVRSIIKKQPVISDIFDFTAVKSCPTSLGYKYIKAGDAGSMCIRLRDGSNNTTIAPVFSGKEELMTAAAFLEPRKLGAILGATVEFRKEEGMSYNPEKNVMYVAISAVDKSMENKEKDPANDIALPKNKCGAVYEVALGVSSDTTGNSISTEYAGTAMEAIVTGKKLKKGEPNADMYYCDPEGISNPDNVQYIAGSNTLLIGEDTKYHINNMVWAFNTNTKEMTRIVTAPTGGEVTGMFANINAEGMFYLFFNVQHPFEDANKNAAGEKVNTGLLKKASKRDMDGHVGYISGLPAIK
ncbi:MAG: alkaline phosphatase [Denitrovibrio sp.]|nr:MAG: alkaline phosphatase [Denitrovibrio sp.]